MVDDEFNTVLSDTLKKVTDMLAVKGAEYAHGDRLSNFKQAAKLLNTSNKAALGGMLSKHIVSVFNMLQSTEQFTLDKWDEKIIDVIAYMVLLRAVISEDVHSIRGADVSANDSAFNGVDIISDLI